MLEGKGFVLGQALELVGLGSLMLTCLELWGGLEQLYSTGMNSRFSLAVHVLTLLATQPEERVTSGFLAMSIGTNPVVIRRLMAKLREAGLVTSKGAAGGGWMLARPAEKISLTQVRSALEDEVAMRMHKESPHPECPVGKGVHQALSLVYGHVDTAIDKALMRMSVADVLADALTKVAK